MNQTNNLATFHTICQAILFIVLSMVSQYVYAQPTDNAVETRYPGQYPWASQLAWSQIFSITQYGGVGDSATDNLAAFNLACQAAAAAGGGVVYFPPGVYLFSKDLVLKNGVILRGETPSLHDAHSPSFRLASRLVFPKYEPVLSGAGTPDSTAFKGIYSENPNTDSQLGLVDLDINRGIVYLATKFGNREYVDAQGRYLATNRNYVLLGLRSNNAAVTGSSRATVAGLGSNVPQGSQELWQRWPNRFIGNFNIEVSANCLVAACRINDNPTDDYIQPGYKYRDGRVLTDPQTTWFRYTDKSAIFVNTQMPDLSYWAADSAKAPWWFNPGIVIRDNWIYRTKRDGIQASGNGLQIFNNIVRDTPNKPCALNPTGLTPAQGFDYNGNRSIWIRGGNNIIVENNHVTGHQQTIGQYASNDGEGIVADNQGSLINGLIVRNNDITCNWAGIYDVPLLKNIVFFGNKIRRNNINSTQDLLIYSKLGGYEGRNNCETCIMDSNMVFANGSGGQIYWTIEAGSQYWITRNVYLTNSGSPNTGGLMEVDSRSLGTIPTMDSVSVYEGCNAGFSRVIGNSRWLDPPTCQAVPTDSITRRVISSLLPERLGTANVSWLVYPNPAQEQIYLGFARQSLQLQSVEVYDNFGKLIKGWHLDTATNMIDIGHLAAGHYLLKFTGIDGRAGAVRFVKE